MKIENVLYQVKLLAFIERHPRSTTSDLKAYFGIPLTSPNREENHLHYTLNYLVRAGYIYKKQKEKMKYGIPRNVYSITDRGRKFLAQLLSHLQGSTLGSHAELTPLSKSDTLDLLAHLEAEIEKDTISICKEGMRRFSEKALQTYLIRQFTSMLKDMIYSAFENYDIYSKQKKT